MSPFPRNFTERDHETECPSSGTSHDRIDSVAHDVTKIARLHRTRSSSRVVFAREFTVTERIAARSDGDRLVTHCSGLEIQARIKSKSEITITTRRDNVRGSATIAPCHNTWPVAHDARLQCGIGTRCSQHPRLRYSRGSRAEFYPHCLEPRINFTFTVPTDSVYATPFDARYHSVLLSSGCGTVT
ncbi:hypothetical protein X777_12857 [Ooceraea biroi]|uniref:Uncharacterized protein n=1 Tax=Ooceraea biroi TaxID=2015173 RepID=A0A026W0V9_OOCBI|nr:hypothetical protein X777_12857 [Ooceraea biroi]